MDADLRPVVSGKCGRGRRSLLALVLAGAPAIASPQALPLEEIVVTARKMAESLADVPLSIEVVGRDRLGSGAFDGMRSLAADVPGLYYETMWGGSGSAAILRGQSSPSTAGDNVGVFVDGVYQAARSSIDVETLDIERVEVVRGPQSTMFGHSTFAGAIHYVSRMPTRDVESSATLEAGSGDYFGASAFLSGPLGGASLLGRLAVSGRSFAGTGENAVSGEALGGFRRNAVAATLATTGEGSWSATLSGRVTQVEQSHPAVTPLTYPDYNCGSQDPVSGAWSYYCGRFPERGRTEVSAGISDSEADAWQLALGIAWQVGELEARSDTSVYRARAERFRDFDATADGDVFGVCTLEDNCAGPVGVPRTVDRLVLVNEVQAQWPEVEELSQEFRVSGRSWMLGLAAHVTHELQHAGFGADGSGLGQSERLTAYLPATPFIVGPLSNFNRALVADPNAMQVEQTKTRTTSQVIGLFGALDHELSAQWRLRGELRANFERIAIDNETANYQPGFGDAIEPLDFFDLTPRLSVEYRRDGETLAYASAARGSHSGGINAIPGLLPEEQGYDPETNWTYELSGRLAAVEDRLRATATVFYIDWDNAQITGFSNSPGVGNLVTLNTGGITTRGLELSIDFTLPRGLELGFDYAYADPRFRAGSDDLGSTRFCGLSATSTTSSFCVVGPARSVTTVPAPLVPYVDGNRLQRTPSRSWRLALSAPAVAVGDDWVLSGRIEGYGQDDVFDRAIGGARYGARTLLDARLGVAHGDWSIELWGLNLAEESYIAAAASRGAAYFPTTPRPLDLIHGPGRRFGITLRYGD